MTRKLSASKKSMGFNVVLVMVITLITGLVLIAAGYQITKKSKVVQEDKTCQMSFFAKAQMSKVYEKSKKLVNVPVSLECPRRQILIEPDSSVTKGGRIIDDLVKAKIANEMIS